MKNIISSLLNAEPSFNFHATPINPYLLLLFSYNQLQYFFLIQLHILKAAIGTSKHTVLSPAFMQQLDQKAKFSYFINMKVYRVYSDRWSNLKR